MKMFQKLAHWYKRLFVEVPDGYGDPVSFEVEKFEEELHEKKEGAVPPLDEKQKHGIQHT